MGCKIPLRLINFFFCERIYQSSNFALGVLKYDTQYWRPGLFWLALILTRLVACGPGLNHLNIGQVKQNIVVCERNLLVLFPTEEQVQKLLLYYY